MSKIAVTYSEAVGGSSVLSLIKSFEDAGAKVNNADYRELMKAISPEDFNELYKTQAGRIELFAHAKAMAKIFLKNMDGLALSGNSAMIDPLLFNKEREVEQEYDLSRTIMELALVHVATNNGMPILGICGGHQVIAVYGGGTISNLSATELKSQPFFNYSKITLVKNSLLDKIMSDEFNVYEPYAFGAHNQKVDSIGKGYVETSHDSKNRTIEALESEHGAPVVGTQFHPEVGLHGLPGVMGKCLVKTEKEQQENKKIFEFFTKAGDAYANSQKLNTEINEKLNKDLSPKANLNLLAKPEIKATQKRPGKKQGTSSSNIPRKSTTKKSLTSGFPWKKMLFITAISLFSSLIFLLFPPAGIASALAGLSGITATIATAGIGLAIGAITGAIGVNAKVLYNIAKNTTKKIARLPAIIIREIVSYRLTAKRITEQQQKEKKCVKYEPSSSEHLNQNSMAKLMQPLETQKDVAEPSEQTPRQILMHAKARLFDSNVTSSTVKNNDKDSEKKPLNPSSPSM